MDFLDLVENYRAADASLARLYGSEGTTLRTRRGNPAYERRFVEALKLITDVYHGRQPIRRLQEAMSTSDFSVLFADIIDRQLYANYRAYAPVWQSVARRARVPDFRTVKRFAIDGAEGKLLEVKELTEYPNAALDDSLAASYAVKKYGRRIDLSWETMVNDDLDAFRTLPERLAKAARRSEDRFFTGIIADANGPHASVFTAGNENIVNATNSGGPFTAVNPPLSIQALQQAYAVLANQLDSDNEPVVIDGLILVVPPSLEITARNIINATEILVDSVIGGGNPRNETTGVGGQQLRAINWMKNRTTLVVDPYLPIISTTNGGTSWYLLASSTSERPALEIGFLRGHETPEIFMKSPNAQLVGGGAADPMMGDFDNDSIAYKVRHVFGGTILFAKSAVASNGSGS